jgi:membrane protein implicated in regulation of membrane protease activity
MSSIYWLIFILVLVGIEIGTMALTTIWFAGGAMAGFILSLFGTSLEAQLAVFVIVSFVLLIFTRPWAIKHVNSHSVKTNVNSLIGKDARVTAEVNNRMGTGTAVVNGQEWTARALDENDIYPADTQVVIRDIQGVKLIVSLKKED